MKIVKEIKGLLEKLRKAENGIKLHKTNASAFYKRKRTAKRHARRQRDTLDNFRGLKQSAWIVGKTCQPPTLTTNDISLLQEAAIIHTSRRERYKTRTYIAVRRKYMRTTLRHSDKTIQLTESPKQTSKASKYRKS